MTQQAHKKALRGRPFGMTPLRQRVLAEIEASVADGGEAPSLRTLARRCGLYDFRDARRAVRALKRLGRLGV